MQTFFRNNKSNELILFFNGWAMDEKPFQPIESDKDILFVSDYSDTNNDFELDFSKYEKIILIAFSAGVFMASYFQEILPPLNFKIAINGTLNMLNEEQGVTQAMLEEMENINFENTMDFRKKIIDNKKHFGLFNKNEPSRNLESGMKELFALKNYFKTPKPFSYDKVIMGKNDMIITYKNQLNAWNNFKNIKTIDGGHFLFYNFNNFDEIIDL